MFAAKAKAAVKCLGADGDLIYNENANLKIEMLTLVKVKVKTLWSVVKYKISDVTLPELLQDPDFTPEYTEEEAMVDFKNMRDSSSGGRAAAEVVAANVKLEVSASMDTVDGVSSFTLKKKTVDIKKLRQSCANKMIKEETMKDLRLQEKEKLAFVYQTVFNTSPATFYGKTGKTGLMSGMYEKLRFSLWSKKKDLKIFTVPKDITFAYSLMEICTENNRLGIPTRFTEMKRHNKGQWKASTDGDDETLRQLMEEIFDKADLLQPLAELDESRRLDLMKTLRELLEDGDALSLLEETLDQSGKGVFECPQSPAVSSFMDLLDVSGKFPDPKDAAHLLVSAMDALPDDAAALLANCSPETLRVLQQLVNNLKENAQATLPESLPDSLQEEGELRWVAELLCLTEQTLTELRDHWDTPEFTPEMMLELVCLVVLGLSLMQPKTRS